MKSQYQIKMNFQQAKADAAKLERVADQMENTVHKKLAQSMRNLSYTWTRGTSNRFLSRQAFQLAYIHTLIGWIRETAAEIRRVAAQVYEAEMRAYEIASRRTSQ